MRSFPVLLLLALLLPDGAAAAQGAASDVARLVVLHLNDWHGQVQPMDATVRPGVTARRGGYVALTDYVRGVRAVARPGTTVWVTDAGDWFQGTPEGNQDRGLSMMACRDRLGLLAASVGNHEYDFGEQNLIELCGRARHVVLGANIVERADPARCRPYVKPFHVVPVGGVRVALVGLVTSDTERVSSGPFGDAAFADEVETLRKLWPELKRSADEVVLVTHCGIAKDRELARAFPELRLILGGHSHTALPKGHREGTTWIVQSGGRTAAISRVDLTIDRGRRRLVVERAGLVALDPVRAQDDPATRRFLAATFAHIGPLWDRPVGRIEGARDRRWRRVLRSTPAGNYLAGMIRRAAHADVGVMNKGGIRTVLLHGPITRRQVFELLPFENTVWAASLTGVQLRTLLAQGLRPGREPLEIDGARYSVAVVDGRRVLRAVEVGGEALREDRRYRVATNSFIAKGGDGYTVFGDAGASEVTHQPLRAIMLTELRRAGCVHLVDDPRIRLVE